MKNIQIKEKDRLIVEFDGDEWKIYPNSDLSNPVILKHQDDPYSFSGNFFGISYHPDGVPYQYADDFHGKLFQQLKKAGNLEFIISEFSIKSNLLKSYFNNYLNQSDVFWSNLDVSKLDQIILNLTPKYRQLAINILRIVDRRRNSRFLDFPDYVKRSGTFGECELHNLSLEEEDLRSEPGLRLVAYSDEAITEFHKRSSFNMIRSEIYPYPYSGIFLGSFSYNNAQFVKRIICFECKELGSKWRKEHESDLYKRYYLADFIISEGLTNDKSVIGGEKYNATFSHCFNSGNWYLEKYKFCPDCGNSEPTFSYFEVDYQVLAEDIKCLQKLEEEFVEK